MLLLLALACADEFPTWTCLVVDPRELHFLTHVVDDPSPMEPVLLTNGCGVEVSVRASISDEGTPFEVQPGSWLELGDGEAEELTVSFEPWTSAVWSTTLAVVGREPTSTQVSLYGEAVAPVIQVHPEAVDLTGSCLGEEVVVEVGVYSIGSDDLWVQAVELVPGVSTAWVDLPGALARLPALIPPGLGVSAFLHYRPTREEELEVSLVVTSNDPFTPVVEIPVTLSGVPCP